MARTTSSQPTDVELQILTVLWECGPQTVREVHLVLSEKRDTGYSTTLKMMQVMMDKGLLRRNETVRPQLYRAAKSQTRTQMQMLDNLTDRAFRGSAMSLVMGLVSGGRLSPEELSEIQELIEQENNDD